MFNFPCPYLYTNTKFQSLSLEELLKNYDKLPSEISTKVRNNAGGVYNHELYFNLMGPNNINIPKGEILNKIIHTYGGFDNFESEFKKAALDVFGSGYTFLVLQNNNLDIINRANQDNPLYDSQFPLLTIDVWEHAYYLMYQNRRDRYINCWFSIINWDSVNSRYLKAINGF